MHCEPACLDSWTWMKLTGDDRRTALLAAASSLQQADAALFIEQLDPAPLAKIPDAASICARALAGLWPAAEAGLLGSVPEISAALGSNPAFNDIHEMACPEHIAHSRRRLLAASIRTQLSPPTPLERVAWALDVLHRLFDRIDRSETTRHGTRQLPSAEQARDWWEETLADPPRDFSDGGRMLEIWKPSLLRGLRAEAGDRFGQAAKDERSEFELGVSMSATLELCSIAAQTLSFSHTLRPSRLFGLLTVDDTWKAFVTRAGELPSFQSCDVALGLEADRSAMLARFGEDLEAMGPLAATAWCQLSLLVSVVDAMLAPEGERLGSELSLIELTHRIWDRSSESVPDALAFPLGWGHARNNLFKKCQRCVPVLAQYPERLQAALQALEKPERWTAHAFRYYAHRWMSDQREDQLIGAFFEDPDEEVYSDWMPAETLQPGSRKVYQSLRMKERPVLGLPCIEDLSTAPVSRALTPIDQDPERWAGFRDRTLVLLLMGGAPGLLPWARSEKSPSTIRTKLEHWRSKRLDGQLYADNPWVNAQNWRYGDLHRAIRARETELQEIWTHAAEAVSERAPSGRAELVEALAPWIEDTEVVPERMKWSICIKNARAWLEAR